VIACLNDLFCKWLALQCCRKRLPQLHALHGCRALRAAAGMQFVRAASVPASSAHTQACFVASVSAAAAAAPSAAAAAAAELEATDFDAGAAAPAAAAGAHPAAAVSREAPPAAHHLPSAAQPGSPPGDTPTGCRPSRAPDAAPSRALDVETYSVYWAFYLIPISAGNSLVAFSVLSLTVSLLAFSALCEPVRARLWTSWLTLSYACALGADYALRRLLFQGLLATRDRLRAPRLFRLCDLVYSFTLGPVAGTSSVLLRIVLGGLCALAGLARIHVPLLPRALASWDPVFAAWMSMLKLHCCDSRSCCFASSCSSPSSSSCCSRPELDATVNHDVGALRGERATVRGAPASGPPSDSWRQHARQQAGPGDDVAGPAQRVRRWLGLGLRATSSSHAHALTQWAADCEHGAWSGTGARPGPAPADAGSEQPPVPAAGGSERRGAQLREPLLQRADSHSGRGGTY
jgi:hypothetical protein